MQKLLKWVEGPAQPRSLRAKSSRNPQQGQIIINFLTLAPGKLTWERPASCFETVTVSWEHDVLATIPLARGGGEVETTDQKGSWDRS